MTIGVTADLAVVLIDARHGVLPCDQAAQLYRIVAGHPAYGGGGQ